MTYLKNRFIIVLLTICILLTGTIPISANNFSMVENDNISYNTIEVENIDIVYDLIEEAGAIKAKLNRYKNYDSKEEQKIYNQLIAELDEIYIELENLGACPTQEVLQNFEFRANMNSDVSVNVAEQNGVLIDDFAGFESMYGSAYDLWGIYTQVNATYGTYDTYEIIIQDAVGGNALTTQLMQQNNYHVQVMPSIKPNLNQIIAEEIFTTVIGGVAEQIGTTLDLAVGAPIFSFSYQAIGVLHNINSQIEELDYVVGSATDTYHVECTTYTTARFVYVKTPSSTVWRHCNTVNNVNIDEYHMYSCTYYSGNAMGNQKLHSTKEIDTMLTPERFTFRLTDAITNYREGGYAFGNISYNVISTYSLKTNYNNQILDFYELSVKHPIEEMDLFQ